MSELIYVDTNVWISLFKQERDSLRPLSDFSFELFRKSLACEYNIVISGWLLKELELTNFNKESFEIIQQFKQKNVKIEPWCCWITAGTSQHYTAEQKLEMLNYYVKESPK
mgnify:CR=1 FL=1